MIGMCFSDISISSVMYQCFGHVTGSVFRVKYGFAAEHSYQLHGSLKHPSQTEVQN